MRLERNVLAPLVHTSRWWFVWIGALLILLGVGSWAYVEQLNNGLAVTGMRDTVIWGLYISNFVFFSGLSMAGTFISAILRITGAEWRRPITRIAELTTVSALLMCALMPVVDVGRPDRVINLLRYGRLESPVVWDIIAITTYLTASCIYLFLFVIPDSAHMRDVLSKNGSKLRRTFYSIFAMGWQGLPAQCRRLQVGGAVMMIMVIPIGVTVHSVVSWIFGMTYRAGWDSTIFAPYFAVGALYSGVAMLITVMYLVRRIYRFEEYFTERHFRYLAYLLAAFGMIYLYFTFAEYLTVAYKLEGGEKLLLQELFLGRYSLMVWAGFLGGQVIPVLFALLPWTRRHLALLFVASILVNVGMWIKRFVIVVPSLSLPLLPEEWGIYSPTWVELAITASTFAGFALVFTLFSKLFPLISLWEMKEGWEQEGAGHAAAPPDRIWSGASPGLQALPEAASGD